MNYESNVSDRICLAALIIFSSILLVMPIYMFVTIWRNFDQLDSEEIRYQYGHFYSDLQTESLFKASFHVVFIFRRIFFVGILIFLPHLPNI